MDSGLLKRLVGAAVLIALAVIFVPMLLPSGTPSGSKTVGVRIPPKPQGELQTRVLQVGPNGASAGTGTVASIADPDRVATVDLDKQQHRQSGQPAAASSPAGSVGGTGSTSAKPSQVAQAASEPQARSSTKPATSNPPTEPSVESVASAAPAASATKPAASAPAKLTGGAGAAAEAAYVVNLGIYADHANARKLVSAAQQHGFKATATPETFQGESVLRVRVGPFPSQASAEAARLKLQGFEPVAAMTVEANVANQAKDAPAAALPANKAGAWAVQLGAFRVKSQANMLRDRLRDQGFDGYLDSVNTSRGKLWRVRAGPFTSRDAAEASRGKIASKLKVKGIVVTQH